MRGMRVEVWRTWVGVVWTGWEGGLKDVGVGTRRVDRVVGREERWRMGKGQGETEVEDW